MNWYLIVKYLHILAVAITIGGMFARQLVRGFAKRSDDIKTVASLTPVALRIDRTMVIPWSSLIFLLGIILALMQQWPIFGFLQGASQNWLLVSNILLDYHAGADPDGVHSPQQKSGSPFANRADRRTHHSRIERRTQ